MKPVGESGGYGHADGPMADRAALTEFGERLRADPRNYIAQPLVNLSRVPCWDQQNGRLAGRHVDLRPYCLYDGDQRHGRAGRAHPRRAAPKARWW